MCNSLLTTNDSRFLISVMDNWKKYYGRTMPNQMIESLVDLFEIIEIQISTKDHSYSVCDLLSGDFNKTLSDYFSLESQQETARIFDPNYQDEKLSKLKTNAPYLERINEIRGDKYGFNVLDIDNTLLIEIFSENNDTYNKEKFKDIKLLLNTTAAHGYINSILTERNDQLVLSKNLLAYELKAIYLLTWIKKLVSDDCDTQYNIENDLIKLIQIYGAIKAITHTFIKSIKTPDKLNDYLKYKSDKPKLEKTHRIKALQHFYKNHVFRYEDDDQQYWIDNRDLLKHIFVSYQHYKKNKNNLFCIIKKALTDNIDSRKYFE